ncbi:MAG TPA: sugar transferase, partial [Aliarcobacter sp.]|nr:sugar transferase [Aliarcobacter sp.]
NYLQNIKPFNIFEYSIKRVMDFLGIFCLYAFTFPIMAYSRRRIKKESPGTSMFKQERVGINNKEFKCIKYRSMRLDAEVCGAQFACQNDPRVFPWGEIMRKTRIDELPQMLNVLKGDMHLIGPRPERKFWIEQFEKEIPYYNERHLVRPGITGWAQVMYPYGAGVEDAKQKLMYDLYYIKHYSIWLDIKIIYKTILVVLGKKGL